MHLLLSNRHCGQNQLSSWSSFQEFHDVSFIVVSIGHLLAEIVLMLVKLRNLFIDWICTSKNRSFPFQSKTLEWAYEFRHQH